MTKALLAVLFLVSTSPAQNKELRNRSINDLNRLAPIGATTDEVRRALGKPQAVNNGFPDVEDFAIVKNMPGQNGQLNNSTWVYYLASLKRPHYYVNGYETDRSTFRAYKKLDTVLVWKHAVYTPEQYTGIKRATRERFKGRLDADLLHTIVEGVDSLLVREPKQPDLTYYEDGPEYWTTIYCVIFDRGTNVVAGRRHFIFETIGPP